MHSFALVVLVAALQLVAAVPIPGEVLLPVLAAPKPPRSPGEVLLPVLVEPKHTAQHPRAPGEVLLPVLAKPAHPRSPGEVLPVLPKPQHPGPRGEVLLPVLAKPHPRSPGEVLLPVLGKQEPENPRSPGMLPDKLEVHAPQRWAIEGTKPGMRPTASTQHTRTDEKLAVLGQEQHTQRPRSPTPGEVLLPSLATPNKVRSPLPTHFSSEVMPA
ncbi:hypothetical protein MKEN_00958600 [Mycena kentingensis (nom. inval.)]|nr:hypothetical protein MKEN_00958600 [Mycena kentingensis (nom. inval.)]